MTASADAEPVVGGGLVGVDQNVVSLTCFRGRARLAGFEKDGGVLIGEDLPIPMDSSVVLKGTMGTKSAAMTVKVWLSSDAWIQLLMPVLTSRRRCVLPDVSVVSGFWPPYSEVMVPLMRMLSAIGGPCAWCAPELTWKL